MAEADQQCLLSGPSTPSHLISPRRRPARVEAEGNLEEGQQTQNDEVLNPMPVSQILPDGTRQPCVNLYSRFFDGPKFGLPNDWIIEYRPRTSQKYLGKIDQFFYELKSGRQFRSVTAVEKYLKRELLVMRSHMKRQSPRIFGSSSKAPRIGDNPGIPIHIDDSDDEGNIKDNGDGAIAVADDGGDNADDAVVVANDDHNDGDNTADDGGCGGGGDAPPAGDADTEVSSSNN